MKCSVSGHAGAVAGAGAGLAIYPEQVDAEGVADAVGRLLENTGFRAQARRVADEIASMPSPDAVAPALEALV